MESLADVSTIIETLFSAITPNTKRLKNEVQIKFETRVIQCIHKPFGIQPFQS